MVPEHQSQFADHVIVLGDGGHIIEQGDHQSLTLLKDRSSVEVETWSDDDLVPVMLPKATPESSESRASNTSASSVSNIGDLSIYAYYSRSVGWLRGIPLILLVCACTVFSRMQRTY